MGRNVERGGGEGEGEDAKKFEGEVDAEGEEARSRRGQKVDYCNDT